VLFPIIPGLLKGHSNSKTLKVIVATTCLQF